MGIKNNLIYSIGKLRDVIIITDTPSLAIAKNLLKILKNSKIFLAQRNSKLKTIEKLITSHEVVVYCLKSHNFNLMKKIDNVIIAEKKKGLLLLDWNNKHFNKRYWKIDIQKINIIGERILNIAHKAIKIKVSSGRYNFVVSTKNKKWMVMDGICKKGKPAQFPDGEMYVKISEFDIKGRFKRLRGATIVEFGIGFNPNIGGNEHIPAFDEKALGTTHLGFAKDDLHYDVVFRNAHLEFITKHENPELHTTEVPEV